MPIGFYNLPKAVNETVKKYEPHTEDYKKLMQNYEELYDSFVDIPMYINGKAYRTDHTQRITPPHDHQHPIGRYHKANDYHVDLAIQSALVAKSDWEQLSFERRAAIFLRAAELIAGPYRYKINAATMLGQSKNIHQAEIDACCELVDFLRFNVMYMQQIYQQQPESSSQIWNRLEYRALEGFIYAATPFNFTAIAANLPLCCAMMGNTVIWKPSDHQVYSANIVMEILKEAGMPDGVINMVYGDAEMITDRILVHPEFAGLHFTGSTKVFKELWKKIGANIFSYKNYPRIVGETGGKDFILAHRSCDINVLVSNIIRGGYEFQGQKCSASSRVYIPKSIWATVKPLLIEEIQTLKVGSPDNADNFMTAVIHQKAFDRITNYIEQAKEHSAIDVLTGGNYDSSKGYFIEPVLLETKDPNYISMHEEIFGPIVTVYVYEDDQWDSTLSLVDQTSTYALTGSIIANSPFAIEEATQALTHSAGNLYINDKPTGAVVGQQPFGGGRASGTNDKAGSMLNLLRWVSPRTIKEVQLPTKDYRYK